MAREITLYYVIWSGNSQICLFVQGSLGVHLPQHSGRHDGLPKALQSYPWSLNEGMGLLLSSMEKIFLWYYNSSKKCIIDYTPLGLFSVYVKLFNFNFKFQDSKHWRSKSIKINIKASYLITNFPQISVFIEELSPWRNKC